VVNLVKFETVENLVMQLKEGNVIAKETVIDDSECICRLRFSQGL